MEPARAQAERMGIVDAWERKSGYFCQLTAHLIGELGLLERGRKIETENCEEYARILHKYAQYFLSNSTPRAVDSIDLVLSFFKTTAPFTRSIEAAGLQMILYANEIRDAKTLSPERQRELRMFAIDFSGTYATRKTWITELLVKTLPTKKA